MRNKPTTNDAFIRTKAQLHDKTRDNQKKRLYAADHNVHAAFPQLTLPQVLLRRKLMEMCKIFGIPAPIFQPSPRLTTCAKAIYNHRRGPMIKIGGHGTGGQRSKDGHAKTRGGGWSVHLGVVLHELAHILAYFYTRDGVHHNDVYAGVLLAVYQVAKDTFPDSVPDNITELVVTNYEENNVAWVDPARIEFIRR